MTDPAPATPPADPVRARRAQIAHASKLAQRVGYLLFAVAVVAFFVGFFSGFTTTITTIIVVLMAVGSVLLAPAIVAGYAVKAAERDDLEHGR
jgi:cyanate permease